MAVAFHERGTAEPLPRVLHLRVAERQPYLLHFAGGKEPVYDFYVGAQEGRVA